MVLGGLHFTVLRILIIAGLARRAARGGSSREASFREGFNGSGPGGGALDGLGASPPFLFSGWICRR